MFVAFNLFYVFILCCLLCVVYHDICNFIVFFVFIHFDFLYDIAMAHAIKPMFVLNTLMTNAMQPILVFNIKK